MCKCKYSGGELHGAALTATAIEAVNVHNLREIASGQHPTSVINASIHEARRSRHAIEASYHNRSRECGIPSTLAKHGCFEWCCAPFDPVWFSMSPDGYATGRYDPNASDFPTMSSVSALGSVIERQCTGGVERNGTPMVWTGSNDSRYTDSSGAGDPLKETIEGLTLWGVEIEWETKRHDQGEPAITLQLGGFDDTLGADIYPLDDITTTPSLRPLEIGRSVRVILNSLTLRGAMYVPLGFKLSRGATHARPALGRIGETRVLIDAGPPEVFTAMGGFAFTFVGPSGYTFTMHPLFSESAAGRRGLDALDMCLRGAR